MTMTMTWVKSLRLGPLAAAIAGIALAFGFATSASAQDVRVNWSQQVNFANYKTFAWAPNLKPVNFLDQFVPGDVESVLTSRGFVKVPAGQPADLLVSYTFVTDKTDDTVMTSSGYGWSAGSWGYWGGWGGWGPMGGPGVIVGGGPVVVAPVGGVVVGGPVVGPDTFVSNTETVPRLIGILSVDLIDAKTNKIIWRGQATEDNVAQTQKGDEKQIHSSVKKMFDHFPPKQH
jgi:hypothetical protein